MKKKSRDAERTVNGETSPDSPPGAEGQSCHAACWCRTQGCAPDSRGAGGPGEGGA